MIWAFLAAASALFVPPLPIHQPSEPDELEAFLDRDLREHPEDQERVRQLLGLEQKAGWMDPKPWYVWRSHTPPGYFVFEGRPLVVIPGASAARVHRLTRRSKKVASWEFQTGWRADLVSATLRFDSQLKWDVIKVDTGRTLGGRAPGVTQRQYYAFVNGELHLVRIEDAAGKLVQNTYEFPNQTIGPLPENPNHVTWAKQLGSDNAIRQLAALTYLGGRHAELVPTKRDVSRENVEIARLVHDARMRSDFTRDITDLANSTVPWIRMAALETSREILRANARWRDHEQNALQATLHKRAIGIMELLQTGQYDAVHAQASRTLRTRIKVNRLEHYTQALTKRFGTPDLKDVIEVGSSLGRRTTPEWSILVHGTRLSLAFPSERRDVSVEFAREDGEYRLFDMWMPEFGHLCVARKRE